MTAARYCENCRATLSEEASFCKSCGASVRPSEEAIETSTPETLSGEQLIQQVYEYVFEQVRHGVGREDIVSALTESGWDKNTVEAIIDHALSEVQAKASSRLLGTLANVLYVFSGILIVFMVIDLASSWIFKFDITGNPASAFFAGILASILGFLGRQIERGRVSGSSLRTLLSFIFGIIGIIIFGGFVWGVVNGSGLLGDRGLFPDHFHGQYINSGNEYLKQGQYSQAIVDFSEAILLDPEDAITYYNRGIAYGKLDQPERAIEDYTEAILLDPQYANAYYNRGLAYGNLGQHEQVILDFDAYIRLDPDDASAYFIRAYSYYELDQPERAIEDYSEGIRLDPQDANAYFRRAYTYYELDQPERAIEDYSEGIRLDPQEGDAYYNRGIAYRNLGQQEQADRDFAKAKELGVE